MFFNLFNGPRKFYVALPPGNSPSPSRTPSITPTVTPSRSIGSSPPPTPTITPSITTTPQSPTPTPTPTKSFVTPSPSASPNCTNSTILDLMQQAALQFMQTSIIYYKIDLNQTKKNLYGESLEKWFYQPFDIKCSYDREPNTIRDEMFGPDVERIVKIIIPKSIFDIPNPSFPIAGKNMLPEIGDILLDRSVDIYYEVHNIIINYLPLAANFNTGTACPPVNLITYELDCHHTRSTRLNLLPYKII
jgi:hypothetical protein